MKDFEDYLEQIHADQYEGYDDDMPDDFDNWVSNLESDEMYQYAQDCVKEIHKSYEN